MGNKCMGFKVSGVLKLDQEYLNNIDYHVLDSKGELNNLTLGLFTYLNKNIKLKMSIGDFEFVEEGNLQRWNMLNGTVAFVIVKDENEGLSDFYLDEVLWENVEEFIKIELELVEFNKNINESKVSDR